MASTSAEKNDSSPNDDEGSLPPTSVLKWFDPNSWWLTMSFSGGVGSIVTLVVFLLVITFGSSVSALLLLGPLTGGIVAGYLLRKYHNYYIFIGAASGLLAALPVVSIVSALVYATRDVETLSDSWMDVVTAGGLGLSTSAGITAIGVLILVSAATGAFGRLIGNYLVASRNRLDFAR